MVVFLAGAILAHVSQLDPVLRGTFTGLFVLSLYMVFRGFRARTVLSLHRVAAIDLGAPGWLTAALAILGVIGGSRMLHRLRTQVSRPAT